MEIVIINFALDGMTTQDYELLCEQVAPAFAAVEGLRTKVWLADPENNTYGGVYTFASEADVDAFFASQLATDVRSHPNLTGHNVRRFHVLDEPTRITHGLLATAG